MSSWDPALVCPSFLLSSKLWGATDLLAVQWRENCCQKPGARTAESTVEASGSVQVFLQHPSIRSIRYRSVTIIHSVLRIHLLSHVAGHPWSCCYKQHCLKWLDSCFITCPFQSLCLSLREYPSQKHFYPLMLCLIGTAESSAARASQELRRSFILRLGFELLRLTKFQQSSLNYSKSPFKAELVQRISPWN